jgi:NTP pyrophosphatase (non-canonical NTP hydrolase)
MADLPVLKAEPTLADVQEYIAKALVYRGHNDEELYAMLMLCEEVGELAKAVRKHVGGKVDPASRDSHIDEEAADVFWVLVAICNKLGIDLEKAFRAKEEKNKARTWH